MLDDSKRTGLNERMSKAANEVDVHVGARVRLRRMLLEISQERLADRLGITFQQVQKYEKGMNRIGASRLFQIAEALNVGVEYFFEDLPVESSDGDNDEARETSAASRGRIADSDLLRFVGSSEGMQLNAAFSRIDCVETRRRLVDLVKTLARPKDRQDDARD